MSGASNEFIHVARAARVVFGAGSLQHLEREVLALGSQRALILCTSGQQEQAAQVAQLLGARAAGIFARAEMHVPIEVAREACDEARALGADCAVAIGGGSTLGLGKAIALDAPADRALPILAIPTTYAGSEMTPIYGITEGGLKRTGTDVRVLPRTVIYDPLLTLSLPADLSVTSGINAMAHAAEGLYARDANPVMALLAEEGIRALTRSLPLLHAEPSNVAARTDALYGAWLCGTVLGSVGMALHHKLCHTLGGSFGLPHAPVHTVILPHALAYNAAAVPTVMRRIARAMDADAAPLAVQALAKRCGAPLSLAAIGMREADLDRAADIACANPYWNPRAIERGPIRHLLQRAFDGAPPCGPA